MGAYQREQYLKDIKVIDKETQISTPEFLYGFLANRPDVGLPYGWCPDFRELVNGHFLICGLSGSGKTTMLRQKIRYLNRLNKHIFVIDMQGDMIIKDWVTKENSERVYEKIGNYIELSSWGSEYGIPAFEFDTGATMKELQRYIDGETPDEKTMKILKSTGPKVQVEDMIEIIQKNFLPTMGQEQKNGLYDLLSDTYRLKGFVFDDYKTWLGHELPNFGDTIDLIQRLNVLNEKNINYLVEKGINYEKYIGRERILNKLGSYIRSLHDSGIFHSNPMPVKEGLNIIDISGLGHKIQRFMADIFLGKIFKACKIRGEYKERPVEKRTRGDKGDTFIIIDEASLITGGKSKNDPWGYAERIAKESRKYGLNIGVAAQSSSHFPVEFLRNFATQIILNTNKSDFDNARKNFAVDKDMLSFTHQNGGALIKTSSQFVKIRLPIIEDDPIEETNKKESA